MTVWSLPPDIISELFPLLNQSHNVSSFICFGSLCHNSIHPSMDWSFTLQLHQTLNCWRLCWYHHPVWSMVLPVGDHYLLFGWSNAFIHQQNMSPLSWLHYHGLTLDIGLGIQHLGAYPWWSITFPGIQSPRHSLLSDLSLLEVDPPSLEQQCLQGICFLAYTFQGNDFSKDVQRFHWGLLHHCINCVLVSGSIFKLSSTSSREFAE